MSKFKRLSDMKLTRNEQRHPLWQRFEACLEGELARLRSENDHAADIANTTLRRGEIACVKRILALSDEVGPESSESEAFGPESHPAGDTAGIPLEL